MKFKYKAICIPKHSWVHGWVYGWTNENFTVGEIHLNNDILSSSVTLSKLLHITQYTTITSPKESMQEHIYKGVPLHLKWNSLYSGFNSIYIITSLAKEVMFFVELVCLFVCLFVCFSVCGQH